MPQTTSPRGVPPLGLGTPVVLSLALLGVATLATGRFLQVVGLGPTATAQGVRLIATLAKG